MELAVALAMLAPRLSYTVWMAPMEHFRGLVESRTLYSGARLTVTDNIYLWYTYPVHEAARDGRCGSYGPRNDHRPIVFDH